MPNHITNKLTIYNNHEEGLKFLKGENGAIDFNKITPMPGWVFQGNLSEKDKEKYGDVNCWYTWSIRNWGTKWNAYKISVDKNIITFDTAWASPIDLILKLGRIFPDVDFLLEYADEAIGSNCGTVQFKFLTILKQKEFSGKKAIKFGCELKGYNVEDYLGD